MRSLQDWMKYVDEQAAAARRSQQPDPASAEPVVEAEAPHPSREPEPARSGPEAVATSDALADEVSQTTQERAKNGNGSAPARHGGHPTVQAVLTWEATTPITDSEPPPAARRATGFTPPPTDGPDAIDSILSRRPARPFFPAAPGPEPAPENHDCEAPASEPERLATAPALRRPPSRPASPAPSAIAAIPPGADTSDVNELWNRVPRHIQWLVGKTAADLVTQNSYKPFRDTRDQLVRRLMDPELTLEEVARVLGVCPTTVRRYTNRGKLNHHRTAGNQRRFRLSDVLEFLEAHGPLKDYNAGQDATLDN